MKNVPNDQELYRRVIAEAKKKCDVYPSAYANGWVVQEYKRRGGTYRLEKAEGGLKEWFKEKWVDISRPKEGGGFEPCGRPDADKGRYPKCVPESVASKMTPEEIESAIRRKRRAESTQDRDDKKPINVSTFKKEAEKAKSFASRSEAGRYAASMRWQNARGGAGAGGNSGATTGVSIGGSEYQIGLENPLVDNVSGATQYAITSPKGKTGMLQVFPDGMPRVIGLPSMRLSTVKLIEALRGKVPGIVE